MKKQIGNFFVEMPDDDISFLTIRTASVDWSTTFAIGTAPYSFVQMLLNGDDDVLHTLIVMWYEAAMIVPDGELVTDHRGIYDSYYARIEGQKKESEESEEEILNDLKRAEEINGEQD